jgi:hypothetical protein
LVTFFTIVSWTIQVITISGQTFVSGCGPQNGGQRTSYWLSVASAVQTAEGGLELVVWGREWINVKISLTEKTSISCVSAFFFLATWIVFLMDFAGVFFREREKIYESRRGDRRRQSDFKTV